MNPYTNADGDKFWRNEKGLLHREDGPAVEYTYGENEWWLNGKKHRVGGPAVEHWNGNKYWFLNGEYHREDGPAIECLDGVEYWYYHGKFIDCSTQEEFNKIVRG